MITLYTKNLCTYCVQAKQYLSQNNIEYDERNIENDKEAREFLLAEGHRSVPQIYYKEKLLVEGGCNKLLTLTPQEVLEKIKNLKLKYSLL